MQVFHGRRAQTLSSHFQASGEGERRTGCLFRAHGQQRSFDLKGREGIKGLCLCKEQLCLGDKHQATAKTTCGCSCEKEGKALSTQPQREAQPAKTKPCTDQSPAVLRSRGTSRDWLKHTSAYTALSASPQQCQESHHWSKE